MCIRDSSLDGETHRGTFDLAGLGSPGATTTPARARDGRHGERLSGPVHGGGPAVKLSTYKGTIRLREG